MNKVNWYNWEGKDSIACNSICSNWSQDEKCVSRASRHTDDCFSTMVTYEIRKRKSSELKRMKDVSKALKTVDILVNPI